MEQQFPPRACGDRNGPGEQQVGSFFDEPVERRQHNPPRLTSVLPAELIAHGFAEQSNSADLLALLKTVIQSQSGAHPTSPPPPRHIDLYRAMSALQKAIRIGNTPLAMAASRWLIERGFSSANWKRLRTIAVEDVGLGDPEVASFVLWLAGRKDLRAECGDLNLSVCAINCTTQAVKSRDMSDLAFWSSLPGSIDHLMSDFGRARSSELVAIASNPADTLRVRHAATRALFPFRFPGADTWKRRRPEDRMPLYEALEMPRAVIEMIEADVAFGGDDLTSAAPMAWALMRGSKTLSAGVDSLDPGDMPLVGDVLGSTYDRHTRLGRRILRRMLEEHEPWAEFFRCYPAADPMECIMRAVFYAEGGVLRPRLSYDGSSALYWSILEAKFATTGIASLEQGGFELLELVRRALPKLNKLRREGIAR